MFIILTMRNLGVGQYNRLDQLKCHLNTTLLKLEVDKTKQRQRVTLQALYCYLIVLQNLLWMVTISGCQ